jgi:hypothetical protein
MRSLFTWALGCFFASVILAMISLLLGTGLNYQSYLILFHSLTAGIILALLASIVVSIAGVIRERYKPFRYLLLMAANILFFVWVMME